MVSTESALIVGAGPIGLACAIAARRHGLDPLVIDAGAIAESIVRYPVGMTFFTTPDRLEIGGHPLVCAGAKATREEALMYYRGVARAEGLRVRTYTRLVGAEPVEGGIRCELERTLGELRQNAAQMDDPDDVVDIGKPADRRRQHIDAGATRHVVEDLRNWHGLSNFFMVLVQTFLGRLVVIRRNQQAGVGANLHGRHGQFDRFISGVGAGAGNYRYGAIDLFHRVGDHPAVFFHRQRGGFTGGAYGYDRAGALADMHINERVHAGPVDRTIVQHGGYERYDTATDHFLSP